MDEQDADREVSGRELAAWLGISTRRLTDLTGEGVFPKDGRGRYPLKASVLAYCERMRRSAMGRATSGDLDLTAERARLAKMQADGQELKNAIARGEYVAASSVEAEWTSIVTRARSRILAVPSRIRQSLSHLTAHDVEQIDREIRIALTEIGNVD